VLLLSRVGSVRSILGYVLVAAAAVVCLLASLTSVPSDLVPRTLGSLVPAGRRSDLNLLVITLDTTRADAIGTYGGRAVTPTLDQLADTGFMFEQASTVAPLTLPAHCSLFTGLFPPGHHVHGNGQALASGFVTLAERLNARGFETGAFVSSFVLDREWGLNQGFDVYRDVDTHPGPIDRTSLRRPADRIVDDALGWLHEIDRSRFFAWLHFYDAHAPSQPPAEFASPNGQDTYAGAIGFIDFQLSRVISFLDERGLLESTVVVIVGDHGESLGEHGEPTHGLFVYQSVIHVPLIIRVPVARMQGRRVTEPVRVVDILPTVLDLLGQTAAPATDGTSLVPLMSGAVKEMGLEAYSESRYGFDRFGWSPLKALRQGRFKLILAPRPELYDLASDPDETTNLYGQRAGLVNALTRRLEEIESPAEAQRAADVPALDSETRARLAALGYVSLPAPRAPIDAGTRLPDPKDHIDLYRQFTERSQHQRGLP
jgi:arylsulfatase A-like enzyme